VSPVTFSRGEIGKTKLGVSAIDPATLAGAYRAKLKSGRLDDLGPRTVLVNKGYADKHHVHVGDTLSVLTPSGRHVPLTVRGITDDKGGLLADLTVTDDVARTQFGERDVALDFVTLNAGVDAKGTQKAIDRLLEARYPVAEVLTGQQFKERQAGQIKGLLVLVYVLLTLSVIVSLFGIVNTLVLSIHERTRELGMLRAIGFSRRQVRRMVRYEAVITSLIGAIVGIVLGALLAAAVAQPLKSNGFVLSFPVVTLVALVVLAALAGVVTAIGPARRAAKLDVLRALAYE
jgi:putative ABC transport system permease protein